MACFNQNLNDRLKVIKLAFKPQTPYKVIPAEILDTYSRTAMRPTDEIFIAIAESQQERDACFAIRREVFVEEQKIPLEAEIDEYDSSALHFIALVQGKPAGTARVVFKDNGASAKIGRVAVLKDARRFGIGHSLMRAIEQTPELTGVKKFVLHAQTYIIPFYQKLGYAASGEEFMEDGIPHYFMQKDHCSPLQARAV